MPRPKSYGGFNSTAGGKHEKSVPAEYKMQLRPAEYDSDDDYGDEDFDDGEYFQSYTPFTALSAEPSPGNNIANNNTNSEENCLLEANEINSEFVTIIKPIELPKYTWLQDSDVDRSPVLRAGACPGSGDSSAVGGKQKLIMLDDFRVVIATGNVKLMDLFLGQDVIDINEVISGGWTPLVHAASSAQPESVSYLLDHGAVCNPLQAESFPALSAACASTSECNTKVLACVSRLLESKADVNAIGRFGMTALMYAVVSGRGLVCRALIQQGVLLNTQDDEGLTALMWATRTGRTSLVRLLLSAGADASLRCQDGSRAVHLASHAGHRHLETMLGADPVLDLSAPISEDDIDEGVESSRSVNESHATVPQHFSNFQYDKLESFLLALDLRDLIPGFRRKNISFQRFLRFTDADLLENGVQHLTVRKKIIDALKEAHKRAWTHSSLPSFPYNKKFTCPDAAALLANVRFQASVIASTVGYLLDQIQADRQVLAGPAPGQTGPDSRIPKGSVSGDGQPEDQNVVGPLSDEDRPKGQKQTDPVSDQVQSDGQKLNGLVETANVVNSSALPVKEFCDQSEETLVNVHNLHREILRLCSRLNKICRYRTFARADVIVESASPVTRAGAAGDESVQVQRRRSSKLFLPVVLFMSCGAAVSAFMWIKKDTTVQDLVTYLRSTIL